MLCSCQRGCGTRFGILRVFRVVRRGVEMVGRDCPPACTVAKVRLSSRACKTSTSRYHASEIFKKPPLILYGAVVWLGWLQDKEEVAIAYTRVVVTLDKSLAKLKSTTIHGTA